VRPGNGHQFLICITLWLLLFSSGHSFAADLVKARINCERAQLRGLWEPRNEMLRVAVQSSFDETAGGCFRTLRILRSREGQPDETLYREQMAEHPIAVWPLSERLLTIWGSGSALWVTVYSSTDKGIRKVLDVRPKATPEIEFLENGSERLVFTNYDIRKGADGNSESIPVSADIYTWTDGSYSKRAAVPWPRRFEQ
jgi:hypothetical protein